MNINRRNKGEADEIRENRMKNRERLQLGTIPLLGESEWNREYKYYADQRLFGTEKGNPR